MRDVVIVAAKRTAIGSFGGGLSSLRADQLGTAVIKAVMEETGVAGDQINEVILGQVLTAGCGQNPARQSAINAGLPASVPAITINKVCGSGLKAVHMAVQAIQCGDAEMILAGGQESMSQAPHVLPNSRNGQRMGNWSMIDTMITDGLWDAFNDYHMGITAENIVEKYGITRDEQDAFAAASQQKAVAAQKA
ncbi:MAG: beta-ketoacyl synthase N-terminal-like domain-containing protein, partial [Pseudomonadota bacterium]|nr:beta-ketoacyl synthase N-terminal-like domain-containing protein [Pseudomonadota bacterium]